MCRGKNTHFQKSFRVSLWPSVQSSKSHLPNMPTAVAASSNSGVIGLGSRQANNIALTMRKWLGEAQSLGAGEVIMCMPGEFPCMC